MSAAMQLITVEKLIVGSEANISEIKSRTAEHREGDLEVSGQHVLLSDAEATLAYLNELLEALRIAVGGVRHQA
ncbi:MAG: hypothetical protein AB7E81_22950 [Hyphomicrobiaceae bacterium]